MDPFVYIFGTLVAEGRRDFKTEVPDNLKAGVKQFLEDRGLGHLTE